MLSFFIVQLSHPYMTTGKTIALTRWTYISKLMPLFLICCHTDLVSSKIDNTFLLAVIIKGAVNYFLQQRINDSSFSSVQLSHSVMSNSLRPHESQHARPPCPSPTPRVHSDSRPSSQWYHPPQTKFGFYHWLCSRSWKISWRGWILAFLWNAHLRRI